MSRHTNADNICSQIRQQYNDHNHYLVNAALQSIHICVFCCANKADLTSTSISSKKHQKRQFQTWLNLALKTGFNVRSFSLKCNISDLFGKSFSAWHFIKSLLFIIIIIFVGRCSGVVILTYAPHSLITLKWDNSVDFIDK